MVSAKDIALEVGRNAKDVIDKAKKLGIKLSSKNGITIEEAGDLANYILSGNIPSKYKKKEEKPVEKKVEEKPERIKTVDTNINLDSIKRKPIKPYKKSVIVSNDTEEGKKQVKIKKSIFKEETKETFKKEKKEKRKPIKQIPKTRKESHVIDFERSSFEHIDDNLDEEVFIMDTLSDEVHREQQKIKEEADARARALNNQNNNRKRFTKTQNKRVSGKKKKKYKLEKKAIAEEKAIVREITVPDDIRVYEFADKLNKSVGEIISTLFGMGLMITKNDFLDSDTLEILAAEYDIKIDVVDSSEDFDYVSLYDEINPASEFTEKRPPVVTIMGHVDHGKTSLLDKIRNSKIASGEAGGITQHIGAYMIETNGEKISFLDTPGHEAFTEMRARGASVTDLAIIVVAGDDGVKPQTLEALNHTKAAEVPILIAITKMDKPDVNIDKVKSELAEAGYSPTDWGGEYDMIQVSSKTGKGIDQLLEHVLIQAEVMELKANHQAKAKGIIVESSVEIGRGTVATVVMQNGTLHIGDSIVSDIASGVVRTLIDDNGKKISQIGPSEMAVITGLDKAPAPGSVLISVDSDSEARKYAESIATYKREKELSKSTKVSFDELSSLVAEGKLKTLPIILKADAQGSLEAIKSSLEKLTKDNDEVRINIIHSGVGGITESDVSLADASENSIILGFNIRPVSNVKSKAKQIGIEIKTYTIIYDLIDDVKAFLGGMLSPLVEEEQTGQAEIRETFKVGKDVVAGCIVTDGIVQNGINIRVIRDGAIIYQGEIGSLKRFKDDAKEVKNGFECGIMIKGFNDIKTGDFLETYKEVEKARDF